MIPNLEAALTYADMGWLVLPSYEPGLGPTGCSCPHTHCGSPGKHPRTPHGYKNASRDSDQIRAWWEMWPSASVGIATGHASGIVVLDVDPRHSGDVSLHDLLAQHGKLPRTAVVATGGGGVHLYFAFGDPLPTRDIAPGVTAKADGGFVIAPPSLHLSGRRYTWEVGFDVA